MIGDDLNTDIKGAIICKYEIYLLNTNNIKHHLKIWKEVQNLNEIKKYYFKSFKVLFYCFSFTIFTCSNLTMVFDIDMISEVYELYPKKWIQLEN